MTLWWIGDVLLLVVLLPIVVYLLSGVLKAAQSIVPSVRQIADVAAAGSRTSMPPRSFSRPSNRWNRRLRASQTTAARST